MAVTSADLAGYLINPPDSEEDLTKYIRAAQSKARTAGFFFCMETDDMTDDNASKIYGCKVTDGLVTYNKGDTAPRGCLGYYKVLMRNGTKFFKGYYYPRVRAALGNDNAQTRGNSITFNAVSTAFTVFADDDGDWRKTKTFTGVEECKKWINAMCKIDEAANGPDTEQSGTTATDQASA